MVKNELAVKNLIGLLRDSEKGFNDLGVAMHGRQYREFFLGEARVREVFALQLERALSTATGVMVHETGTTLGTIHRTYADMKAKLGAGDHAMLGTVQHCERFLVGIYRQVLKDVEMPDAMRALVAEQEEHVRRTHGLVRRYHDALER